MITRIPEAFVFAFLISVSLNIAFALTIADIAHHWGIAKGKLCTFEEVFKQSKVAHIDASFGRKHD